jgi:hypothetical protein
VGILMSNADRLTEALLLLGPVLLTLLGAAPLSSQTRRAGLCPEGTADTSSWVATVSENAPLVVKLPRTSAGLAVPWVNSGTGATAGSREMTLSFSRRAPKDVLSMESTVLSELLICHREVGGRSASVYGREIDQHEPRTFVMVVWKDNVDSSAVLSIRVDRLAAMAAIFSVLNTLRFPSSR